jgi:hypothetical protein
MGAIVPRPHRRSTVVSGAFGDRPGIGVQEHFRPVKAQSFFRGVRSECPQSIETARFKASHEKVPVIKGFIDNGVKGYYTRILIVYIVEQQQFHRKGIMGVDAKIYSVGKNDRP